ncbi:MAG: hypothetical protein J5747_03905 [Spirochaetaceae bacterium]|nr:hypothetical protein [Spirochaetaceae bacterium]
MKYAVNIPNINLDFSVPPSKSVVHRQLIISFLLQTLNSEPDKAAIREIIEPLSTDNDDIRATRGCLKALYEASCAVDRRDIIMPCNESGSTLRFMMSVGAAYLSYKGLSEKKRLVFEPKGKLIDRPLDQLIECLSSHGISVFIDKEAGTVTESGNLTAGVFEIQGNISSQYISGLLMALVLLPNSSVKLLGALESKGYFELTVSTLKSFGIKINELNGLFTINTISALCENKNMAEGDWSSASFLLCLGSLVKKSRVVLNGLNKNSIQKDKVIVEILSKLGIKTEWNGNSISLDMMSPENTSESKVQNFQTDTLELDASDYPDIVPYIAVVAAARAKLTKIKNVERLRFKECDRVEATIKALSAVGVKAEELDGTLVIHGGLSYEHGTPCEPSLADTRDSAATKLADVRDTPFIETFGDHRMAMTACLIAAWTGQTVYIDNKDCVNKSFPGLFELIEKSTNTADDGTKE